MLAVKRMIKKSVKAVVTISLLVGAIYYSGPGKIWDVLSSANPVYFLPVIGLAFLNIGLSSKKVQLLLEAKKHAMSFGKVVKFYLVGKFFNTFLPTQVGGDVVKAKKIAENIDRSSDAYSAVFMERFTGLIALTSIAVVASTAFIGKLPNIVFIALYAVFVPGILAVIVFFWHASYLKRLEKLFDPFLGFLDFFNIREKVDELYRSIKRYENSTEKITEILAISLLFQVLLAVNLFILSKSVGMEVPLIYFFVFIPISDILLFLPISIKGFGLREAIYAFLFPLAGATAAEAVSLSFLVHGLDISVAAVGSLAYIRTD